MRMPEPPSLPDLPSLPDVAKPIGIAIDGAEKLAGKIADLTGISSLPTKIEESVLKIKSFADEQIDSILNGAANAMHSAADFATETLERAEKDVLGDVQRAVKTAKDLTKEIEEVPAKAAGMLSEAERVLKRARKRRDSIRKWNERFRRRREEAPKIVSRHIAKLSLAVETEFELEAAEAEKAGTRAYEDTKQAYDKTVSDAKRFGGEIFRQTMDNRRKGIQLKRDLQGAGRSTREWVSGHVRRVQSFKNQRSTEAKNIRSVPQAKAWVEGSVEGAHRLATVIREDAEKKPGEVMTFGKQKVNQAMELWASVQAEMKTAQSWVETQRGTNAAWKRQMAEIRKGFEDFSKQQGSALFAKFLDTNAQIAGELGALGKEEIADTAREGGATAADVQKSIQEFRASNGQERNEIAAEFGVVATMGPETGEPGSIERTLKLEFPEESEEIQAGGQHPEATKPAISAGPKTKKGPFPEPAESLERPPKVEPKSQPKKPVTVDKAPKDEPPIGAPKPEIKVERPKVIQSGAGPKPPLKAKSDAKVAEPEPPKPSAGPQTPPKVGGQESKKPELNIKPSSQVRPGDSLRPITPKKHEKEKPSASLRKESGAKEQTPAPSAPGGVISKAPAAPSGQVKAAEPPKRAVPLGAGLPPTSPVPRSVATKKPTPKELHALPKVQKKSVGPEQPEDPKLFHQKLVATSGAGAPPDPATRSHLLPHVGFDPSMVRLHTGAAAAAAARAVHADAFTMGRDIFFAEGKYDPTSPKGLGLIGHEVTHVGQQLGLRGDKLRFDTKTGGDAMEQEAQEVGERIAANLSYGTSLRLSRYIRVYEPADDEPITPGLQARLDRISMQAIRKAAAKLAPRAQPRAMRIDEVEVGISLDLQEVSDQEAVEIWAAAIVAAVQSAPHSVRTSFETSEALAQGTHVLQRRLGNEDEKSVPPEPKKELDPAQLAKLAKVTATAEEKAMIRKLLVRKDLDPIVSASKAKQHQKEFEEQYSDAKRTPVRYSGRFQQEDLPTIEAKLKEFEINSWEDFEKLKKDFTEAFNTKGLNVTNYILDENLRVVLEQKPRYLAKDAKDPNAQINKLKKAAQAVLDAMNPYIATIRKYFSMVVNVDTRNLDTIDELLLRQTASGDLRVTDDQAKELRGARSNWVNVRRAQGNEHVVLLGRDFDPNTILQAKSDTDLDMRMLKYFSEVEDNIRLAKGKLNREKFWELAPMVDMTKSQMGVRGGEGADKTIREAAEGKAADNALWNTIQAGAAIALAVTAMVATGGLAAVALVGSAGLSVYGAAKHADEYMFKMAAANSALDQAKLISKDEPALFWLALDLVAAGLDLGAAVGAFNTLAKIARSAMAEKAALKDLEIAARAQYKSIGGMKMTEDQFVARLLESAKKGVKGAEEAVKQIKLVTELIEGTSARAAAILKGDPTAIKNLVVEYSNWRGLMGALTNGGEDAAKMAQSIGAYRKGVISKFKGRGGVAELEESSAEIVSDFDLNVKATAEQGAGERVLAFEKEMSEEFGANWSEALHMNFYTDKSQLLSLEEALKSVSPVKRAAILKEVTEKSEKLNFAKMLEHAGDDEKAIKQVEEMMKSAGVKYSIDDLRALGKEIHARGRAAILKEIDGDVAALNKLPPKDPKRISLAESITKKQMEANFLSTEAYIGPAAVKGGPLTNAEAYQSAMSQLEMMQHVMGSSGGDVVKACREYEFFKYVNRYAAAARKAGVKSPGLDYFEGLSAYVYKRARSAHMETGGFPGVTPVDEAATGLVDDAFLIDQYNMFRKEVNDSLPKIKAAAEKNPAGGWKPDMPQPRPAAGEPPAGGGSKKPPDEPPPSRPPESVPPSTKPGGQPAGLPAAAQKSVDAAKKMAKTPGTKVPEAALDPSKRLTSAGFGGSGTGSGVGVYKTTIPGVPHEVVVKMFPKGLESKMEQELAAALAAEKTGIGPKVHGKITGKATADAPERVGFAMDEVKGGFADTYAAADDAAKLAANKADMMKNAANIKPETFTDLESFRNAMFDQGFYYRGELQGFVDANGRWKPIDMAGAEPVTTAKSIEEARKIHDGVFDEMRDDLLKRSLEARAAAAKEAKSGGQ